MDKEVAHVMRYCYIDNGCHRCNGKRTQKGKIPFECWACSYLDVKMGLDDKKNKSDKHSTK